MSERAETSSLRIVLTLCVAGVFAGLLLVFVYQATQPAIQAYKAEQLRLAVAHVLQQPTTTTTLYLVNGELVDGLPEGADPHAFDQVFLGAGEDGNLTGVAVAHSRAGFQEQVKVIFGWKPSSGQMLGMKVLESKETPGLGDKIEKDQEFIDQFRSAMLPLIGVKKGAGTGDAHQVDTITGATISSRTVIDVINEAYKKWQPLVDDLHGSSRP